jgi:hypothetical protein
MDGETREHDALRAIADPQAIQRGRRARERIVGRLDGIDRGQRYAPAEERSADPQCVALEAVVGRVEHVELEGASQHQ